MQLFDTMDDVTQNTRNNPFAGVTNGGKRKVRKHVSCKV